MKQSFLFSIIFGIIILGFLVLFISIDSINYIMFGIAIFTMLFSIGQSYFEDEKIARLNEEKYHQLQNKKRLEKEKIAKKKELEQYKKIVNNIEGIINKNVKLGNGIELFKGMESYFSEINISMNEIYENYSSLLNGGKNSMINLENIIFELDEYINFVSNRIDDINKEIIAIEKKEHDGNDWIILSIPVSILACTVIYLYKIHTGLISNVSNSLTLFTLALTMFSIVKRKK